MRANTIQSPAVLRLRYDNLHTKGNIMTKIEWITTKEAAEIMGVEIATVSRLCRAGKLNCIQHGEGRRSVWTVDKASAIDYEKSVGGRPKKDKETC